MFRTRTIFCFLLTTILAVFALQYAQQPAYPLWIYASLGMTIVASIVLSKWMRFGGDIAAALIGILLSLLAVARSVPIVDPGSLLNYADGRKMTIEGTVATRPEF